YFIIGLPGETEQTIRQTIDFSKKLPLDLALFHVASPYPGTPFFFQVMENGWFRQGTQWEEVDMDRSTVLDYANLKAEDLERWQKQAWSARMPPPWAPPSPWPTWSASGPASPCSRPSSRGTTSTSGSSSGRSRSG